MNLGEFAPDFELMNQDRQKVKLSDFRGKKKVVLLFYPMDFSPTCTEEHCSFGAAIDQIQGTGDDVVVFGVNCDHPFSHAAYRSEYKIPYDLLSDTNRRMVKAYGMFAGEEPFNCAARGTVVINRDGVVAHYEKVGISEKRSVEGISAAVAHDIAEEQRANEYGEGSASR